MPAREPTGGASAGVRVSFAAGDEDLDARAATAAREPGGEVEGPMRTPWNSRDLHFRDADGYVVVFTAVDMNADMDSDFARRMRASLRTAEE